MSKSSHALARSTFLAAAHTLAQLPADGGREVAFAGRSNAGKSSALNTICNQNALARTSKTPGRTQQLVFFEVMKTKFLVDLPGYGYAKVSKDLRAHWQDFINDYLRTREALCGLVIVMDIRHPLREFDLDMLRYAADRGLPAHCLLTKCDKIGRGPQAQTLLAVRKQLPERATAQVFSSETKQGIDEARAVVAGWLEV